MRLIQAAAAPIFLLDQHTGLLIHLKIPQAVLLFLNDLLLAQQKLPATTTHPDRLYSITHLQ